MGALILVDFTWTPRSARSFTVGGDTFPYSTQADAIARDSDSRYEMFKTDVADEITFTATAESTIGLTIVEYKWFFGDGRYDTGIEVDHTYVAASPQMSPTLVVTDSADNKVHRTKLISLYS